MMSMCACYLRATQSQLCPDRYNQRMSEDARTNAVFRALVDAHAWSMQLNSGPLNSPAVAPQALLLPLLEKEGDCEHCLSQHPALTVKCTMGLDALIPAFLTSRANAGHCLRPFLKITSDSRVAPHGRIATALVHCAYRHAPLSSE